MCWKREEIQGMILRQMTCKYVAAIEPRALNGTVCSGSKRSRFC